MEYTIDTEVLIEGLPVKLRFAKSINRTAAASVCEILKNSYLRRYSVPEG